MGGWGGVWGTQEDEEGQESKTSWDAESEFGGNIQLRVLGVKRLTQSAERWENHVLDEFLVADPSTELQPHTSMSCETSGQ